MRNKKDGNWYVVGAKVAYEDEISIPYGTIKKLIGKNLSWLDEPVELTE